MALNHLDVEKYKSLSRDKFNEFDTSPLGEIIW